MPGLFRRRGVAFALCPALGLLAACETRDDNRLGVGFIEDLGDLKAVRETTISPPAAGTDFQLDAAAAGAGLSTTLLMGARPGYDARTFLRFDTATLPTAGTALDSAVVRLVSQQGKREADPPFTMTIHRITSDWNESSLGPTAVPSFLAAEDTLRFDSTTSGDTARATISGIAQHWVDAPGSAFGVAFLPGDGIASLVEFASGETSTPPSLVLHWSSGGADTTVVLAGRDDTFLLAATVDFVPLAGVAGRLTVARGIPARSLLRFSLPDRAQVPEFYDRSTINRAEVILRLDATLSRTDNFAVGLAQVLEEPWQGAATEVGSLLFGSVTVGAESDSVVLVVTGLVEEVVASGNRGFLLRAVDERPDADYLRFHGHDSEVPEKRPTLRVWYTPGDRPGGGS